eukprot:17827-Heterococcus_DN1.PRE.2
MWGRAREVNVCAILGIPNERSLRVLFAAHSLQTLTLATETTMMICTCIAVVRPIIYAVKLADNRARIYFSRPLVSMLMPQPLPVRQHSSNDSPKAVGPAKVLHTTAGNGKRGMQPARYVSAAKPQAAAQAAASTESVLPAEVRFKQMPTAGAHSPSAPDARFKRDNSTADTRLKRENSNVDGQLKRDNSNVDGKARLKRDNSAIGAADSDAYRSGGSAGHHRVLPVADLHLDSSATAPLSPRSSPASPRTTPQFKRIASTAHDTDDSVAAAPASPRAAHRAGREARVLPHGISRGPSMADSVGAEAHHSLGGSVNSGAHAPAAAALAAAGAASTAAGASAAAAAVPASQRAALHAQQRLLQRQQSSDLKRRRPTKGNFLVRFLRALFGGSASDILLEVEARKKVEELQCEYSLQCTLIQVHANVAVV